MTTFTKTQGMKSPFILFILFLAACTPPPPPPLPAVDKAAETIKIDALMDAWHHAAAVADEDVFFGSMSDDAVYLGTDKTERWDKEVFKDWSAKYFERDTAWAFTPYDRVVYLGEDGDTAWFEEVLKTWMGPCRGSGVLRNDSTGWKIVHYNLAMLIDNDDVDAVLEAIKAPLDPTEDE